MSERTWRRSPWLSLGAWLALALAGLMVVNTVRAFVEPAEFARYMGLPLSDASNAGFVQIYGLRAAFLGLFALVLLWRADMLALGAFAAVAVVMPLGDAALAAQAGAPLAVIARHLISAAVLVVMAYVTRRWAFANSTND
jgi:hypothetical protein